MKLYLNIFSTPDGPLELKRNAYLPYQEGPLRPNGNVAHDTSYDSQKEKQIFENEMNRRNESMKISVLENWREN